MCHRLGLAEYKMDWQDCGSEDMYQNRNFLQGQKLYEVRVVFQQIPSVIEAPERNSVLVWPFWFWFGIFVLCQENQFGLEMGRDAASRAQAAHFFQQAARVRFTLYLRNELVLCWLPPAMFIWLFVQEIPAEHAAYPSFTGKGAEVPPQIAANVPQAGFGWI